MSLLFKHPITGGEIRQSGAKEIPSIIRRNKIDLIVLAAEEFQPKTGPVEFEMAEKVYVPLDDNSHLKGEELKYTINNAKLAANEVIKTIMAGGNALVTCKAGWNRSGLISGLALRRLTRRDPQTIISSIRRNRSPFALSNSLFVEIVKRS